MPDHARVAHVFEPGEDFPIAEHVDRDAMELRQVERFDTQPPDRAGKTVLHPILRIARHTFELRAASELGRDVDAVLVGKTADAGFRLARAIDIGRIPEIDLERPRRTEDFGGGAVADWTEITPELPAANPLN